MYDEKFYASQSDLSHASARLILPEVFRLIKPNSVVDVGCGMGAWLAVAIQLGVRDALGLDGGYVNLEKAHIKAGNFRPTNLEEDIKLDRRFDMAFCLEVAEHLTPSRAQGFVRDLTLLSDLVVFSAALPGQTGTRHLNENWLEYWALLFRSQQYGAYDAIRPWIARHLGSDHCYRQNMLLFARQGSLAASMIPREYFAGNRPLSYVLPHMYLHTAHFSGSKHSAQYRGDLEYYYALCNAYVGGQFIDPHSPNLRHYGTTHHLFAA